MACDQSFNNKNSLVNITILVVDDDPIVLSIVSAMLKASNYKDSSLVEITVTTVKNSSEALSTLRVQRDNIDLVITDYHMPGMNGIELKKKISEEFNKLPVVVMSSDTNNDIEQETLSSGALFFMTKPIKPNDLNSIWQYALSSKMGKSIKANQTGNDDDDDNDNNNSNNIAVVHQSCIEEIVPCREFNYVSAPVNANNREKSVNDDGDCGGASKKERKRKSDLQKTEEKYDKCDIDSRPPAPKKAKVVWTNSLHNLFLQAIRHIGLEKAVPKKILQFMNVPGLSRENIASHLQKYRIFLKKVAERGAISSGVLSNRAMNSNFAFGHINSSAHLNHQPSKYGTGPGNRPLNSQLGFGLGQSKLPTSNVLDNPCLYDQLNRSTSFGTEPNRTGTSLLPTRGNFGFANGKAQTATFPSENEAWRSLIQFGIPSKIGQTSQTHGFRQHSTGSNNSSCLNLNLNWNSGAYAGKNYAGIRINDKGDLIGLGTGRVNGNGNGFWSDLGSMNWNFNSNVSSQGSNPTHHQGFGNLSVQEAAASSSCSSLFSPALQMLLSNAGPNKGQSQTDIAFSEFNKLSIGGQQQELVGDNGHGGLPCDAGNFQFNRNQHQGQVTAQNTELTDNSIFEGNQLPKTDAVEENSGWGYNKINEGGSNGETLISAAASEKYSPAFDNNPNQAQFVGDFTEILSFNQDWGDDDFMASLFDYGIY